MVISKVVRRIIQFCLLLIVINYCNLHNIPNIDYPIIPKVHKTLYVDKTFTNDEIEIIQEAILEWERCTNKIATFTIKENFDSKDYSSINDVNAIILLKFKSNNPMVKYLDLYHKNNLLGFYIKESIIPVIGIIPERVFTKDYYYSLVLHEIGHSMGMSHINDQDTVMYPLIDKSSIHLSESDLNEFCKIHKCKSEDFKLCNK